MQKSNINQPKSGTNSVHIKNTKDRRWASVVDKFQFIPDLLLNKFYPVNTLENKHVFTNRRILMHLKQT